MKRENRGPWYLLTGFGFGLVLGLFVAWVLQPVRYTNTAPAAMRSDYKDQYRLLISVAYAANPDLVRAGARIALLKDPDVYRTLAEQAQRLLAQGGSMEEARALGLLAAALKQGSLPPESQPGTAITQPGLASTSDIVTQEASQVTETMSLEQTPEVTATLTTSIPPTLAPTRTPMPTPGGPFVLTNQELLCQQDFGFPLIQVYVFAASGEQAPAVEIVVTWEGGENHFYTGLKPEVGLGYADFTMTPGVTYTLRLAAGGQPIAGLVATECQGAGDTKFWGAWRLEFVQP